MHSVRPGTAVPADATGVADHLAFAGDLIDRLATTAEARARWRGELDRLVRRLADPDHHLAVVGEFSSGKTTLLNTLLGTALMPASASPTTVAAVSVRHSDRPTLRATFTDGTRWRWRPPDPGAPADAVPGPDGPASVLDGLDLRQALAVLATDETLARHTRRVEVGHPLPDLPADLVLIDTPGTNAEYGHTEVARAVVADADAAVVVLPATRLLPDTLVRFLTDALDQRLLDRCVFVVTQLDPVDPAEHERITRAATRSVTQRLGIADPQITLSAPGPALAGVQPWARRFAELRTSLHELVVARRPTAVADTALRLVERLLADLGTEVDGERQRLAARQRDLAAAGITDLARFLADRRRAAEVTVRDAEPLALDAVAQVIEVHRADVADDVDRAVRDGTSLEKALRDEAPALVRTGLDRAAARCLQRMREVLDPAYRTAVAELDEAFEREYARLERATGVPRPATPALPVSTPSTLVGADSFAGAFAVVTDDRARDLRVLSIGAASGAAFGALVVPVVGAVIGALIGLVFGAARSRRIASVKQEAAQKAVEASDAVFADAARQLDDETRDTVRRYVSALHERLDWYDRTYRSTVADLRARQEEQRAALADRARYLNEARLETDQRLAAVDAARSRLSARPTTDRSA